MKKTSIVLSKCKSAYKFAVCLISYECIFDYDPIAAK